jgi:chemotaxis protein MotA
VKAPRRSWRVADASTVVGLLGGVAMVWLGHRLGGGALRSVLHGAAALIVFGGTAAAAVVSFSFADLRRAGTDVRKMVFDPEEAVESTIGLFTRLAIKARRKGILSLEDELPSIQDPFLSRGLGLVVDGTPPNVLRDMMEIENESREDQDLVPSRVFDAAGGYAPTFGILGAVLGLIQVMENLTNPDRLGAGIAVAFVATVYGVASANLVFLPLAAKLRGRALRAVRRREVALDGLLALQAGLNPLLVEQTLRGFLGHQERRTERTRRGAAA